MSERSTVIAAAPRRPAMAPKERLTDLPPSRLVQNWKQAHDRALAYLTALGIAQAEGTALVMTAVDRALASTWEPGGNAVSETMRAVRQLVEERYPRQRAWEGTGDSFLAWRLEGGLAPRAEGEGAPTVAGRNGLPSSMPPMQRRSMVSGPIERSLVRRFISRWQEKRTPEAPAGHPLYGSQLRHMRKQLRWTRVAHRRRFLLMLLVLVPTVIASGFMMNVLPQQGRTPLEVAIAVFFGALFGWISIGFWTATLGFITLVRGRDRFAITTIQPGSDAPAAAAGARGASTALVMPIRNEPVDRVFAGLQAIYRSVERAGALDRFHFFVLSDTDDPAVAVQEEEAWLDWCRATGGFDHIFYRRRKVRIERKAGNVGDFCRRWGQRYRYVVMLDMDSVMSGETLARLVDLMDRNPNVGMIQTAPVAVNRRSLYGRVQQFASRVYGPVFAAGLHYWQLGDGQFWGHNAIIRLAPFMDHCVLPRLPGKEPLGGEILSHDFVEAALMGRAGWSIWLAHDLGGSYEESTATLLEDMTRDRRWCQGNLQHLRLVFTEGLFGAHRALFLNGALSYMSALLWFSFIVLSTVEAVLNVLRAPDYFPHGPSLFPDWPIWRPDWALAMALVVAVILFLPKVLSILLIVFKSRSARLYGGVLRLARNALIEIVLSSLLAPIRMVFHSRFVLLNLLGRTVGWRSQTRNDVDTPWAEAIRRHGVDTLFASAWGAALFWLNPQYFWWVTPIIGALILSVPLSVYTSRASLGERARRWGFFLIPEETAPPRELRDVEDLVGVYRVQAATRHEKERDGFVRAAVDPCVNALRRALAGHLRRLRPDIRARRQEMLERALAEGPEAVTKQERRVLLQDPQLIDALHQRVWELDQDRAVRWGRAQGM